MNPNEPPISHMLNNDPPDHTRLRRPLARAFTARRVEELRPRIEQIADELLDAMAGRDEVDLVADYALPLPVTVICELLGVPERDRADLRRWSTALTTAGKVVTGRTAGMAITAYFARLVEDKRRDPGDDLLSALIRDSADQLSEHELMSTAVLLLTAGHETTVQLIANGALALLRHPDQLAALRADRSLLPGAVEEFLRHDGPLTTATGRIAAEPVEIGGVTIPRGESVFVGLGSANRDAARFPDPDACRWTGMPPVISRSGTGSTTASERRWPGWRARSPSSGCSTASRRWRWRPTTWSTGRHDCSAALPRCPFDLVVDLVLHRAVLRRPVPDPRALP